MAHPTLFFVIVNDMNEKLKIKLAHLPKRPGVYMMKDKNGTIIYIGKAKYLKNRVSSYFHARVHDHPKTALLVSLVADIELLITDSEIEALILEANLVKEHKPRFNVNLKDDKRFPYLKLTVQEKFPRLLVTRRVERDGARYFGPYTNAYGMRKTLKFLMHHFGLRSCNFEIPSPTGRKYKVCLDYHINRCAGACIDLESEEEYKKHIDAVVLFLSGRQTELIKSLKEKMQSLSDELKFEEAAKVRDTIDAMESVWRKQKVDVAKDINRDVIAYARDGRDAVAVVLQIREGLLIGRQDMQLQVNQEFSEVELLSGFLKQYYNHAENLPMEIFLPLVIEDIVLIEKWLTEERGGKVRIMTPQKGEKVRLVSMAETNARLVLNEILLQKKKYKDRIPASAAALRKILQLEKAPQTISCFDISNLGNSDKAASLVYFERGKPKKSEYRHFKIKTVEGQDDFASMREVFTRYVRRRVEEKKPMPDLMMVDGGKGQLSIAVKVLREYNLSGQPVIGLAKRLEEVFIPNKSDPMNIPKNSPALNLLKRVRDEAHRFAITYNRKLRGKRTIASELNDIVGVGDARCTALLKQFGSVKKIKIATVEDLAEVKSIPRKLAEKIYLHFHMDRFKKVGEE
ncbi:MAG: excinuclease ABC subunit UvrC [candidate division Zixibacteria bacterium]|nr:excinuclease ABC subunit UvrC [candidate division Zixibacteria bacterium]